MLHRICARGILIGPNDTLLLAMERHEEGDAPFWVLPGGGMEPGDATALDCALREFHEETGLSVEAGPLLYVQHFTDRNDNSNHVGLIFMVHSESGAIHETDR